MTESGGDPDLTEEPVRSDGSRQIRVQDLDGNGAVMAGVARQEHRGHAAAADLPLNLISAAKCPLSPLGEGGVQPGHSRTSRAAKRSTGSIRVVELRRRAVVPPGRRSCPH